MEQQLGLNRKDDWMDRWMTGWTDGWMNGYIVFRCYFLYYLALEPQHLFKCQGTFVGHKVSTFSGHGFGTSHVFILGSRVVCMY